MEWKLDFTDKVVIVTGSSRGIGLEIAKAFNELGAKVVISSRKMENLEKAREEFKSPDRVFPIPAHAGKVEELKKLIDSTYEQLGQLDILVNNAATNPYFGPMVYADEKSWDKIMEVDLKGYFFTSKFAIERWMNEKRTGAIVNITSVAGFKAAPGLGVYGIAKAGVIMMTKVFAREAGPLGIRVNAVAPGLVKTRFSSALWSSEEILNQWLGQQSVQKLAMPEDIVGSVLFLASPLAEMITGEVILVDGGSLA